MKFRKILSLAFILGLFAPVFAQSDLLKSLDSGNVKSKPELSTGAAFKALQVVNMQSTKVPAKKELYMVVSHRFGALGGEGVDFFDNFFGMDKATTKLGFIYGLNDWFSLGISRQTPKLYEGTVKYRLALQNEKMPVTIVGYNTMNVNTALKEATYPNIRFSDKLSYSTQLLLSRMVNDKLSLELAGVWIHKNLIDPSTENKNEQIIAGGARYKISNRVTINGEYGLRLNPASGKSYYNPASIGVDIDTGGHVFQLVLSNSQKMNDVGYFTNTTGQIGEGGIFFGFNMYRVF